MIKIIKIIKSYYISKEMWKAKMKEPVIFKKITDEEIKSKKIKMI